MGRELPMFQPPAAPGAHGSHMPQTIAMGGGSFTAPAADGSTALRRHPDWIKARDASEAAGKIVTKVESIFAEPTDFSAIK